MSCFWGVVLFILITMWSQLSLACSPGYCAPDAQLLGRGQVPVTLPVLVIGPRHCYLFDEIDLDGVPYDIELSPQTMTISRSGYDEPVGFAIEPSPHREDVYYIKPDVLYAGHTYTVTVNLPERANETSTIWSTKFRVTDALLPPKQLSIGVEASTPKWNTIYENTDYDEADCGSMTFEVYERQIRGTIPESLNAWRDVLVWRVNINGQWQELSPFDLEGTPSVLLRRFCSGTNASDVWPEQTYMFEAFIPGTDLVWRSNALSTTLNCPTGNMIQDMSPDMPDMSDAFDMSDTSMPDMDGGLDMNDMSQMSDMSNAQSVDTDTENPSGGGCAQASQSNPSTIILICFGVLFGFMRRRLFNKASLWRCP